MISSPFKESGPFPFSISPPPSLTSSPLSLSLSSRGLGHLAIQFAKAMGMHVVALSRGTEKKALAEELGAHEYIDSEKGNPAEQLQAKGGAKVIVCESSVIGRVETEYKKADWRRDGFFLTLFTGVAPSGKAISSLIPGLAAGGQLIILAVSDDITVPAGPSLLSSSPSMLPSLSPNPLTNPSYPLHAHSSNDHQTSFNPRLALRFRSRFRRDYRVCQAQWSQVLY